MSVSRFLGPFFLSLSLFACSGKDTASARTREGAKALGPGVAPRPAVVTASGTPYKAIAVGNGGTINGTVDFDGDMPLDTVIQPTVDQKVCGTSIIEQRVARSGTRVGGVLVWLTDIRTGKPVPLEKRFELTNEHCTLDPHVQAIYTTSTLNVGTEDRTLHTNKFINVATGQLVAVAPFNDDGEVVPYDRTFTETAQIEVTCEQHPWTRAYIAVLDHPYFAKTAAAGSFSIDGVPPGTYRVRAWHPSLGLVDDSVTVAAGQQVALALRIRGKNAPAAAAPVVAPVDSAVDSVTTPLTGSSTPARL